jgi:hypothetical protein
VLKTTPLEEHMAIVEMSIGIVTFPRIVEVDLGEAVHWQSSTGGLTVSFRGNSPFVDGADTFVAPSAGQQTQPAAVVRNDATLRGQHFACTVTLDGRVFPNANGVDIRPPSI